MSVSEGFFTDMSAADYHADPCEKPSLSSSIAKYFVSGTPRHAWTAHPKLNPDFEPKSDDKFDLGTVAHEFILGKGSGFVVLDFDNWQTKAAREAKEAARDCGKTPILLKDFARVDAMAEAAGKHLEAHGVDLSKNANECVMVWREGAHWCRSMVDSFDEGGVIYDVKTTDVGLSDASLARLIVNLGYDLSAGFYARGAVATFPQLAGKLRFRWIFIETRPPHELRVIEASAMTMELGARKADFAIKRWSHCMETGEWPGYARRITTLDYPAWAESQWLEYEIADAQEARA
jgi:hypothetical protein